MKKVFYFILLYVTSVGAQVNGETVYNFLNLTGSAKQAALGGNTLTLLEDVNQPLWNPAAINSKMDNNLALNYVNYLADVSLVSASYAHLINRNLGTMQMGITYLNYGNFIGADENGNETGNFKAYDMAFSLGYAYNFPKSDFYLGANLKLINSVIENYSSFGVGGDLSLLYLHPNKPMVITLVARNFGYQVTAYDEDKERLPFQLALGLSYKLEKVPIKWHFSLENLQQWDISESNPSNAITNLDGLVIEEKISFFDNALRHISLGMEIFTESNFNIRAGYNFKRAKELMLNDKRTFAGFTAGFGLKFRKLVFNYAFSKYHPASNASTFSLHLKLD